MPLDVRERLLGSLLCFGTSSSPGSCTRSFALDLKTGLGSTICPLVTHELEVSIDHRSGEILSHEVRRIMSSENFAKS